MNKLLAGILRLLNGLLAILIIAIGAGAGALAPGIIGRAYIDKGAGFIMGLVGGVVMAVVICGVLAVLLEIRTELIKLRTLATEWTNRGGAAFDKRLDREPRLTEAVTTQS